MEIDNYFLKAFLFLMVVFAIFELAILGIAFFGADKVDCNLLWCTFTTERRTIEENTLLVTNQACFINGEEVDCQEYRFSDCWTNPSMDIENCLMDEG